MHANASRRSSLAGRLTAFKMHQAAVAAEERVVAHEEKKQKQQRLQGVDEDEEGEDDALPPPADHREALARLYSRAAPEKVKSIPTILARFEDNPAQMYAVLEQMFPDEVIQRPVS